MRPNPDNLLPEVVKIPRNNPYSRMERIIGIASVVSAVVLFNNLDFNAGSPKIVYSSKEMCEVDDGTLIIVSGNARKNAQYIVGLMNKYNADFGVSQEIQENDTQEIVNGVANSVGVFAPADWSVDPLGGGLGNMTISRGPKQSEDMQQFEGDTDWSGLGSGIIQGDLKKVADSIKERRAALVTSYQTKINGVEVPQNIMGVHVDGEVVGIRQTMEVLGYAEQKMNSLKSVNIILGDFNRTPKELRPSFQKLSLPWVVSEIGATSRDSDRQIDHVIYTPIIEVAGKIFIVNVKSEVLPDEGSDHRAIKSTVYLKQARLKDAKKYLNQLNRSSSVDKSIFVNILKSTSSD